MSWLLTDTFRGYLYTTWRGADQLAIGRAALAAAEAADNVLAAAAMHNCIAGAFFCTSRFDLAADAFGQAVALARRAGWAQATAAGLMNLGAAYVHSGRLVEAACHYAEAADLLRDLGDEVLLGMAMANLGHANVGLGRLTDAARYLEEAVAIARSVGRPAQEGGALSNLGVAYRHLGRLSEAVDCMNRSIAICRRHGDPRTETLTLFWLAQAHRDRADWPTASQAVRAGLDRAAEIHFTHAEAIGGGIEAAIRIGLGPDPSAAERQEAVARTLGAIGDRDGEITCLIDLARTWHRTGEPKRGLEVATTARAMSREREFLLLEAWAITVMAGATAALDRPDEATDLSREALSLHTGMGSRIGEAETLAVLAESEWARGRHTAAHAAWRRAHAIFDDLGSAHADKVLARVATTRK